MKIGNAVWGIMLKSQKVILIISSSLVVLILCVSILMRYVLDLNFYASEELLLLPTVFLYFFGASYGTYEGTHISADFSESFIKSKKVKIGLKVATQLLTLFVTVIFTKWTYDFVIWSYYNAGATTGWDIPMYLYRIPVFVAFALMVIYTLFHLIQQLQLLLRTKGK